ncbi:hypothetical protein NEOKW01_1861 [Nematocida sp. AWRm80]|nr:hypothetical protein NEOKW01_1861 [Nematocida sp. AWRm80]
MPVKCSCNPCRSKESSLARSRREASKIPWYRERETAVVYTPKEYSFCRRNRTTIIIAVVFSLIILAAACSGAYVLMFTDFGKDLLNDHNTSTINAEAVQFSNCIDHATESLNYTECNVFSCLNKPFCLKYIGTVHRKIDNSRNEVFNNQMYELLENTCITGYEENTPILAPLCHNGTTLSNFNRLYTEIVRSSGFKSERAVQHYISSNLYSDLLEFTKKCNDDIVVAKMKDKYNRDYGYGYNLQARMPRNVVVNWHEAFIMTMLKYNNIIQENQYKNVKDLKHEYTRLAAVIQDVYALTNGVHNITNCELQSMYKEQISPRIAKLQPFIFSSWTYDLLRKTDETETRPEMD